MDYQYLSFAHEQDQLDWDKVLISRFGVVQGLNVFLAVTKSGLFNVSISDGFLREYEYLKLLNNIVLPYLTKNKDMIYVQVSQRYIYFVNLSELATLFKESNVFTTSEIVRNWLAAHPNVKYVTWPPICEITSPTSLPWSNMKSYVKDNFPLSRRRLIFDFWDSFKETPNYFKNFFATTKRTIEKVKNEHMNFVREHFQLDWNKTLFARFGVVRCINVLVATTRFGPFDVSISDGLMSEERYLQALNNFILPFMTKSKGIIYVQVRATLSFILFASSIFQLL